MTHSVDWTISQDRRKAAATNRPLRRRVPECTNNNGALGDCLKHDAARVHMAHLNQRLSGTGLSCTQWLAALP